MQSDDQIEQALRRTEEEIVAFKKRMRAQYGKCWPDDVWAAYRAMARKARDYQIELGLREPHHGQV